MAATGWHSGCAVGDYNNDGFPDIYLTSYGPNRLYRNNGDGTFAEVAGAAGVADARWGFPKWSMGAAFGDYDNDGRLDLYVTNFAKFDPRRLPPLLVEEAGRLFVYRPRLLDLALSPIPALAQSRPGC